MRVLCEDLEAIASDRVSPGPGKPWCGKPEFCDSAKQNKTLKGQLTKCELCYGTKNKKEPNYVLHPLTYTYIKLFRVFNGMPKIRDVWYDAGLLDFDDAELLGVLKTHGY